MSVLIFCNVRSYVNLRYLKNYHRSLVEKGFRNYLNAGIAPFYPTQNKDTYLQCAKFDP
jgi:hypothetical protein